MESSKKTERLTPLDTIDQCVRVLINARTAKELKIITQETHDKLVYEVVNVLHYWLGLKEECERE